MPEAPEHPRSEQELQAREDLMRQQFERDSESWDKATAVEQVLKKLKARLSPKK